MPSKKKRRSEEEDGNYTDRPMKKSKMFGVKRGPGVLSGLGRKGRYMRKAPPSYAAGSQEERWYLEILHLGRVICPKCHSVGRKTVEGLKKHMSNCRQEPYSCQHCGKQLHSLAGMKYHVMADHSDMPIIGSGDDFNAPSIRQRLRKMLKRIGRLKCPLEGCPGSFTSVMGYLYHAKKCGKQESELEELIMKCRHCGKAYMSRAGLMYHLKSEHGEVGFVAGSGRHEDHSEEVLDLGRVQRRSAKVASFHLQEIASVELVKEWPKRKVLQDLVPDDRKLKYTRPGLPSFSPDVLRKWRSEMKMYRRIRCPNQGCESVYSSISGLKTHLGSCTQGDFVAGKYQCLLCDKEFISESGVKYHINSMHAEDWFEVKSKADRVLEKFLRSPARSEGKVQRKKSKSRKAKPRKRAAPPRQKKPRAEREEEEPQPPDGEESSEKDHSSVDQTLEESEEAKSPEPTTRPPIIKPSLLTPTLLQSSSRLCRAEQCLAGPSSGKRAKGAQPEKGGPQLTPVL
ncbi:zinc finger protein 512 [Discoglossus pictus]